MRTSLALLAFGLLSGCMSAEPPPEIKRPEPPAPAQGPDVAGLQAKAAGLFKALPAQMDSDSNPITPEKVTLGRMLYFDTRMSKNHDISCNSCHDLTKYGVDGNPTSTGHKGQHGGRNAPTVYNAALHIAQFWDGRAPDVETQARGPVTNPVEMAMPDEAFLVTVLKSIPGYLPLFQAAFPDQTDPITAENFGKAVGAFERTLVTPSPLDRFVGGDTTALSADQLAGLQTFMDVGCTTCHLGQGVGGGMFQKLGLVKPYDTTDLGRYAITKNEADRFFFKVPSLRNIANTGPYFHDGSVTTLDDAISKMGEHQLGKTLTAEQVAQIKSFLGSLTGALPTDGIQAPALPESGPKTPKADPT